MNKNSWLKAEHICFSYGDREILSDITLQLKRGETVAILGPSGCGKTTLLHILLGLLPNYFGKVSKNNPNDLCSYISQQDTLFAWRRVLDNILLPCQIRGTDKKKALAKVERYKVLFGLQDVLGFYPSQLSVGLKKRVMLMQTFIAGGVFWLLDEPFVSLDLVLKVQLFRWLSDIGKELGLGILLVTHDISGAVKNANRIYVLGKSPATVVGRFDVDNLTSNQKRWIQDKIFKLLMESIK